MKNRQTGILAFRKLSQLFIPCLLLASVIFPQTQAPTSNNFLEAYTIREDFQGDGLGQFASYPPAQDIGYEPSITPTSDFDAPGGRALMRVVQPTRSGGNLRFGFIRKVELVSGSDARLGFSYRLNMPAENTVIEIGMAGADGQRYTKKINAVPNVWTKAEIRLSEFQPILKSGVGIEAVYIVVNLNNVNKDVIYRFLIDDVSLSAERAAEFKINAPPAQKFAPWTSQTSAKSYRANDSVLIEAAAPTQLSNVNCILKTYDGKIITTQKLYDDGTHGDKKASDNVWTNNEVYKLNPNDATGVWSAELNGKTANGQTVSANLRFIV